MEKISAHIKQYAKIGIALSAEKNIKKLLEMIVDEAMDLSNADAGTLYILSKEKNSLRFEIMRNNTLRDVPGSAQGALLHMPDVPLYTKEGSPNYNNVSSYVALTGKTVNIPDVYKTKDFNLTGTRKYDEATGYRSISMLVIPLKNHENTIIGVLQLLNALTPESREIIEFSKDYEELVASLASQAAVALTNTQLIQDLKNLFDAFIKSIATTIDEKSPYTGGHIKRVVELTMLIAEEINKTSDGALKDVFFTDDEMEELRIAAWMHDVGKVTTPEYVVDKATKLEAITDRIILIETRFQTIEKSIEIEYLNKRLGMLHCGENTADAIALLDKKCADEIRHLLEDLEFIKRCNTDDSMSRVKINRLKKIAAKTFCHGGKELPYLTENEFQNLSITKGTLLDKERKIIENHAKMTLKITQQLPFPEKLSKVPEYAGGHHEKLDGSGYPRGLSGKELSWQSRIMAVADIFEALTAKDRPYKKPIGILRALKILQMMRDKNQIDSNIYDLFIQKKLYKKYAEKALPPEQIGRELSS